MSFQAGPGDHRSAITEARAVAEAIEVKRGHPGWPARSTKASRPTRRVDWRREDVPPRTEQLSSNSPARAAQGIHCPPRPKPRPSFTTTELTMRIRWRTEPQQGRPKRDPDQPTAVFRRAVRTGFGHTIGNGRGGSCSSIEGAAVRRFDRGRWARIRRARGSRGRQ
jgi:hypothetical protein